MRNDGRSHECSACGGTGEMECREDRRGIDGSGRAWKAYSLYHVPCPVCPDSCGRISDVRTARDAMVDAETLELNRGLAEHTNDGDEFSSALFMARMKGQAAHMAMIYIPPTLWWPREPEREAFFCAYDAAHAAFRAVPALRGEGE